ncbi:O-fucosyltransferase 16-like isoform X2 [Mercurialis annua]|uniref:O-fucosyltransferase 16-like isoform X2 n=1 Tax=Mercurialis annua TaxID=3986 RepID=UPI002160B3C2|nr:O-fucosyltransferase 16-like isoform X2 [Mercurialis annua]
MAFYNRRRHHHYYYNRFRSLLPLISLFSGFLLVLFGLLSIFSPSPNISDSFHHPPREDTSIDVADVSTGEQVFRVPRKGGRSDRDIWTSRNSKFYYGCSNASKNFPDASKITHRDRYLLIATSGGLNQQRTGITDAVVAARILNATLVVPKLDQKSFWRDASNFGDIFDVSWFISSLSNDVKIINTLPKRGGKTWITRNMRVPRKCSERCYHTRVLPVLLKRHAIQLTKFDYRLANKLDPQLQKLRCRVNYHALKFTDSILEMGKTLVHRMGMKSKHFIALHLRFEPDMLAFSGCYYGGGAREMEDLAAIRKRWKTLHMRNPEKERRHGKCPLTPKEVGLMLRALGYGSDVHIYVASGEVYRGEESLAPLKQLFPNFYTKETIASKEELAPFSTFSSRMAALDFMVCDESDVFVTNNNGNMARILAGRRRYFGHKPTIRPNAKKLYRLFSNEGNVTWDVFASKVRSYQRGFMGEPKEVRPGRGEFHENPHTCICEDSEAKVKKDSGPRKYGKGHNATVEDSTNDETNVDDELDLPDPDNDGDGPTEDDPFDGAGLDYEGFNSEEPELEELVSD